MVLSPSQQNTLNKEQLLHLYQGSRFGLLHCFILDWVFHFLSILCMLYTKKNRYKTENKCLAHFRLKLPRPLLFFKRQKMMNLLSIFWNGIDADKSRSSRDIHFRLCSSARLNIYLSVQTKQTLLLLLLLLLLRTAKRWLVFHVTCFSTHVFSMSHTTLSLCLLFFVVAKNESGVDHPTKLFFIVDEDFFHFLLLSLAIS